MTNTSKEGNAALKPRTSSRRYFDRYQEGAPRRVKYLEFSPNKPYKKLPDGTYLYVVIPPLTPQGKVEVRLSYPMEQLLDASISHEDLAVVENAQGGLYVAAVPAAGATRILNGELVFINLNSGHFTPGDGDKRKQDEALVAARLAFEECGFLITSSTDFNNFRDRA